MARRRKPLIEKIWVTRKGVRLCIEKMSETHIRSSIKMFKDTEKREKEIRWLKEELKKRIKKKKETEEFFELGENLDI